MKILTETTEFTKFKGIPKYTVELAQRLLKNNDVHLLTSKYTFQELTGLTVHQTPAFERPPFLHVASTAIQFSRKLKKIRENEGIDIVHTQGADSMYGDVITMHSCHKAAVSQFKSERGTAYQILKTFEPLSNIVFQIEKKNMTGGRFKKIITPSCGVKRELIKLYGTPSEDIIPVPTGVDINAYHPRNRQTYNEKIRSGLGISREDTILLLTGWEFKRKGLRYIVDALPALPKDVKLLVVGGDDPTPYQVQASRLGVQDRLIFTGIVPEIRDYYAASDIFVFPTSYEAFSASTLEAVATGLPILAANVNGTEELIEDGKNGFFIDYDGADIAEKVGMVMDEGIKKMGEKARKTSEDYSWDLITERIEKVYAEIIKPD
ncbi:glycosyltransferase family 4 protein [Candidatus Altiarchaeota archaeon]